MPIKIKWTLASPLKPTGDRHLNNAKDLGHKDKIQIGSLGSWPPPL